MKCTFTVIFFFSFAWLTYSQDSVSVNYNETPLEAVFSDLEKKFNIKFSFNAELTANRSLTLTLENATLEDILFYMEDTLFLKFNKESNRYYTVKRTRKSLTDTQELDEVLIEEYITSGISKENEDASISLAPKNLGILPGLTEPDVLQSIQLLPGVQSPTETASGLFVRGGTPDQNLILWDGIKMYQTGHFFGTISAFNPYITDEIRLYKSGTKARYESRVSGVIDISSFSDIPEKLEGGFGSNMTHADVYLKMPVGDKAAVLVSARRSITDIFESETFRNLSNRVFQETKISEGNKTFEDDEVTTINDLFYFADFTIKATVKANDNNSFELSSLYTRNKLDYGFLIEDFEEASRDALDIINQGLSFEWNHNYSDRTSQTFSAYYSNFDFNYMGSNSISGELNDQLDKKNIINDMGFMYDLNWKLNEQSVLGAGYQLSSNEVEYDLNFIDNEAPEDNYIRANTEINNAHAFYIDYQNKLDSKWFANAGLRANYFSVVNKIFLEPRLQLSLNVSPDFKFKISGELLHQAVSQVVEFNTQNFGLENQIWILSDDNEIPVLRSSQLNTGFIYDKKGWNIDLDLYYKRLNGLTSLTLGFDGVDTFFATGKSDVFGMDFLLKKKIKDYRTWLSYSLINNDFSFSAIDNGEKFPGNTDITHNFFWSHSYECKNFNLSLGWNVRTGIPYTEAVGIEDFGNGEEIVFGATNGARLPNYHRLDASATYKFNFAHESDWKGKVGFSLLNIYDRANVLSRTFEIKQATTIGENSTLREVNKNSLGLTPNVVLRIEF